jgi:hypothetical protein
MKKSVIILIAIIYIASVALVSFFGLKAKLFDQVVYVSEIEILNKDIREAPEFAKAEYDYYVVISPNETTGERKYQIEYRVRPDDATNQEVDFVYDKTTPGVTVSDSGIVTFEHSGSVIVSLIPKDGGDCSVKIAVMAR